MHSSTTRFALSLPFNQSLARPLFALLLTLWLLPSPLTQAQTATPSQGIRTLELGKPIEREMSGGQSHTYQITLSAGQYLNVIVEQRGIDVVVTLFGADGKKLGEVDSPNGTQGPEPLTWITESSGLYRLEIFSLEKAAIAGRYEIKLVELRTATDADRTLSEALSLFNESENLRRKGKNSEAIPFAERALVLREKALGPEHPDVATALNNLAILYRTKSDYAKAELLLQRALTIYEKALGPEHPNVATALNQLAIVYRVKGDYVKAEPLYQRALTIREKELGPEHPAVAQLLNNLANLYYRKNDYVKAEPLYQRALTIREKALGPGHTDVGNTLRELGDVYYEKGEYAKAEPLFQRALTILEKALGPEHRDVALSLSSLALLYTDKGDFVKAEPLFQRSLTIWEKKLGPEDRNVGSTLNNFAYFYQQKRDHVKAEQLLQRSLTILEKALGPEHPEVATTLNNLALSYSHKGDYTKAEPLLQRAVTIYEKTLGPEQSDTANSLANLANVYFYKRDYKKAEPLYQRALAIWEKALGPEHPKVALSFRYLANVYELKGELTQAINFQSRAGAVSERDLVFNLATGSERQKLAYLTTFTDESNETVSLHVRSAPTDSSARDLALLTILQRKGRALDAMTDSLASLRRRASPQDQTLLEQYQDSKAQLANLVLGGPQKTTLAEHQSRVKNLEEQVENLEVQISRRNTEFAAQSRLVTLAAIQSAVPTDAVLVEFFAYRPFNAKSTKFDELYGAPRYVAYVLHHQGEAQWIELGEAKAIDEAVEKLRQALRDKQRKDVKQLARAVDEKVMRPVRVLLGSTNRVFISPDGALNLIPFAALVDERNRYLIQRYSFSYLTSGRDMLRLQVKQPSKQTAMVVANPDFGEEAKAGAAKQRLLVYKSGSKGATGEGSVLSNYYFPPLPGTATEARAIKTIMKDATVLTQAQATETAMKQVSGPRILHIATHGFFLENQKTNEEDERRLKHFGLDQEMPLNLNIENPLLRSGLGLAGANLQKSGDDDGILTAQEAAGLDLWGTKLVVLSACDTGVGEVKNGEGVYGLRRALVLAGSEAQVMSLWPVSDLGTRDLMIGYYKRLLAGQGRTEALRNTQLEMLRSGLQSGNETSRLLVTKGQTSPANDNKKKDRSHPYYWASFIQSGEWANLDGKR